MRSFIVALTAVAACTVSAQTATKKPAARSAAATPVVAPEPAPARVWDKEPEAFLGIKFNEPFNVQKCPSKTVGQYVKTEFLDVASRTIIRTLMKQAWLRIVPALHSLHWGFALQSRLG